MILRKINLTFVFLSILLLAGCSGSLIKEKRNLVTKVALQQIGIKYQFGGNNPKAGFDCSGLVYYSYKKAGYHIPRTAQLQYKYSSRVIFFKKPGDLLFFNTKWKWWKPWNWFKVTHVGIYLGSKRMVQAPTTGSRVSIVNNVFKNRYWSKYYLNTRRIIGAI